MDEFESKSIAPMLFYEENVFDSEEYIFELKFDGARCLAYLDDEKTVLINKRFKDISLTYPELSNIHKTIKKRCVVDGELVVMANKKPSFYQLQKRALLANPLKIKLLSTKFPVTFIAFDILYYDDKLIVDMPLIERKKLLTANISENSKIIISRYIETKGKIFYQLAKEQNLEGIVAKLKTSKYYMGKRSRVWLKIKVYLEDDVIICGYVPKENSIKDLILGAYDQNNQLYRVASVMSVKDKNIIMKFARDYPSEPLFDVNNDEVIWMMPHLVGTVKYMMKTKHGGLRQAIFKGLRDDKIAEDLLN